MKSTHPHQFDMCERRVRPATAIGDREGTTVMATLPGLLRTAMSPPVVSRSAALTAMERISAMTHLVSSLEYLVSGQDRERGGLNDWRISRGHYADWPAPARKALDLVSGRRGTR